MSTTKAGSLSEPPLQKPARKLLQSATNTTESESDTTVRDNAILAIEVVSSVVGIVSGVTLIYGLYKYIRHRQKAFQNYLNGERQAEEGRREQEKMLTDLFAKYQKPSFHFTPHGSMGAATIIPLQQIHLQEDDGVEQNVVRTEQLIEDLLSAVSSGTSDGVQQVGDILANHPELANVPDEAGNTPLHIAIQANHENATDVVSLLLNAGANPEAQTHDGVTLLFMAVTNGNTDVVRLLLDKIKKHNPTLLEANISATYENGSTLLHIAAYNGFAEIAELLLENGADLEALTHEGLTPTYLAVANGNAITLRALFDWKHQVTAEEASLYLHLATQQGNSETLTALLQRRLNRLLQLEEPKEPMLLRKLLPTPTKAAKKRPAQSVGGQTLLHEAVTEGHADTLAELLSTQVIAVNAMDDSGNTALHIAAANGSMDMVTMLLDAGADPDAPNQDGYTPLHRAVQKKKHQIVVKLLSEGANRNARARDGSTALHLAAERGSTETVKLLMQGTRRDRRRNGSTPLHLAIEHGHEDVIDNLAPISDVDALNGEGYTPLHLAVMYNVSTAEEPPIINLLLKYGANPNRRSQPTKKEQAAETPKEMAQRLNHQKIVNKLEQEEQAEGNIEMEIMQ